MDLLTKALLEDLLDTQKTVAIYGGGFKPPTKGHFHVAELTLEQFPEIDELKIFVGGGVRDGITQDESIKIWDIYKKYLSPKVDVEASVAPVKSILGYAKENPDIKVYWILGAREGDEGDLADIENRTKSLSKYPNLEVKVITTSGGVSGTKTRAAIKSDNKEQFFHLIPDVKEKEQIWNIVSPVIKEVGEANLKPYEWKETNDMGATILVKFVTDKGTKYEVSITATEFIDNESVTHPVLNIEFGVEDENDSEKVPSSDVVTNKGELYKVMATVVDIVKYYLKLTKGRFKSISYTPSKKSGEENFGTQRDQLYRAFITRAFPEAKIQKVEGDILVTFPDTQVNEVGEANLKPYKWEEVDAEGYYVYTRFITDSETQYDVDIKSTVYFPPGQTDPVPALEIEFTAKPKGAEGSSAKIVVNKGEMYRVMSTIVDIIKKYIKKSKAQAIIYSPSKKSSEENFGTQRDNLYRAFISKAFPGTTFKQSGDFITAVLPNTINEADPKKGTGKKPEGSGRRLYTDEDPKDTVHVKFKTKEDIVDTLNKASFKAKSHARQSQVINLIHQRVRAAYGKAKDPEVKARLKRALDYIEGRKEASKKKTERLRKMKEASDPQAGTALPYGSGFAPVKELVTATKIICDNCGWEWDKKDGGKDLYICHKCGHDNTPKKDDPFGLNELARQFLKEALIETWNPEESFVSLSRYMIDNGMNIQPLPKIKVIKDDKQNASNLLGKTAYYNPVEKSITLYTMDRHPKDILRSFAHEMIHHEQNLEGRLNNINTTNTNESGDLPEIEREAYEKGNMMFRNWEDKIKNV